MSRFEYSQNEKHEDVYRSKHYNAFYKEKRTVKYHTLRELCLLASRARTVNISVYRCD